MNMESKDCLQCWRAKLVMLITIVISVMSCSHMTLKGPQLYYFWLFYIIIIRSTIG
uniref:Uncharacterized protein n=1 Tax=Anguilla anguilla TaxID=7936 RepID=A0A0E9TLJ0_ANGAN